MQTAWPEQQAVSLQLSILTSPHPCLQPDAQLVKVATGYKQQALEDGGISVRLGDAFSDETKDLLLEVDVSMLAAPHESPPRFTAQVGFSGSKSNCWCIDEPLVLVELT